MGAGQHRATSPRGSIAGGRAPDTPVAAVRWGTRPDAAHGPGDAGDRSPTPACARRPRSSSATSPRLDLAWFERRPLFGRTRRRHPRARAGERAARAARAARRRGASSCRRSRSSRVDFALPDLAAYAWLVFTSANGVDAFFDRGPRAGRARRPRARAACGSPRSARAPPPRSRGAGIRADLVPERFVAESLLDAFPDARRRRRAGAARPRRAGARRAARRARRARLRGRRARRCTGRCRPRPTPDALARVRAGEVDAITFTSSSTVTNFCDLVGPLARPAAARRLDRPGHVADGAASAASASTPRPTRTPSTASSPRCSAALPEAERPPRRTGSLGAWHFPSTGRAGCAAPPRCGAWSPRPGCRVDDLVAPLFVKEGIDAPEPVVSMPGVVQHTQESLRKEVRALADLGIPARDPVRRPGHEGRRAARGADDPDGVVQVALRNLRDEVGDALVLMADDCLDEYTDHGHCGLLAADGDVDNDATLERYASIAIAQADAGADVIAPSRDDGRPGRRDPRRARRGRPLRRRDPRLRGEVRVGALRPVPRRGRVRAAVRRPPRLPDGAGATPARRSTRSALDIERGRRHGDGEARARRTST